AVFRAQDLVWHVDRVFVELAPRRQHGLIAVDRKRGRILRQPQQQDNRYGGGNAPPPGVGLRFGGFRHETSWKQLHGAGRRPGPWTDLNTRRFQRRSWS